MQHFNTKLPRPLSCSDILSHTLLLKSHAHILCPRLGYIHAVQEGQKASNPSRASYAVSMLQTPQSFALAPNDPELYNNIVSKLPTEPPNEPTTTPALAIKYMKSRIGSSTVQSFRPHYAVK